MSTIEMHAYKECLYSRHSLTTPLVVVESSREFTGSFSPPSLSQVMSGRGEPLAEQTRTMSCHSSMVVVV